MSRPALSAAIGRLARAADPPGDGRLVSRFARARDPEAFAELVRRLGPMVLGVCRRVTGDAHLADDAFQAAFLVLARRAADVSPPDAVRGWLYGVAVRVAREARTVSARRRAREAPVASVPDRAEDAHPPPDADALRALDEEVAALPDHLRAAVVLCELDGVARKDAAGRLGVPEGTLSSRLAKGRKLLADQLRKRGVTAPAVGLAALVPAAVPPRLSAAASALATGDPAPAGVAALAHGVVRAMALHKLRAVPAAVGLFAAVVLAAASAAGPGAVPRSVPADPPADPPAPKGVPPRARPGMIVVAHPTTYWRYDPDGPKRADFGLPAGLQFAGGLALSPDGTQLAVTARSDGRFGPGAADPAASAPLKLVVGPATGDGQPKVIDVPGFTADPIWDRHPSAAGKKLYVAQAVGPDRIDYRHPWVNLPAGTLSIPTGVDPRGLRMLDVHPDGAPFLCEQRDTDKKTAKLVLSGSEFTALTDLHTPPGFITARFSPDGKKVLFTDGDPARTDAHKWGKSHRPYVLDVATKKRTRLADFPENGQAVGVAWSPDGRRVAYTWRELPADLLAKTREQVAGVVALRESRGELVVADADGGNARTVTTDRALFVGAPPLGAVDWK